MSDFKLDLMLTESSGTKVYTLNDDIVFYYPYMPTEDSPNVLYYVSPNSKELFLPTDTLDLAAERVISFFNSNSLKVSAHGGKRTGAGRKPKEPTKPVRLNEKEIKIIENFRSCPIDSYKLSKMLIRMMGDLENNSRFSE